MHQQGESPATHPLQLVKNLAENFEVRTMPQKFLNMRPNFKIGKTGKSGKPFGLKKNLIIGIIIIIVLGALMVLAAWLFLKTVGPQKSASPAAVLPDVAPQPSVEPAAEPAQPEKNLAGDKLLDFNSWLAYDAPDFNFNLKYPAEWPSEQLENRNNIIHSIAFKSNDSEQFKITVFNNDQNQDLLAWVESLAILPENLESYTLSNQPGYIYRGDFEKLFNIYAAYGTNLYSLEFKTSDDPAVSRVYNQILATFQFSGEPGSLNPEENPPQFMPAKDSDSDGLTDREEEIYGSDKLRPDSDGDSYTDGDEVVNLYHPTIPGSARLYESSLAATYVNPKYNYNIIYPVSWQVKGMDDSVLFQDAQGEFVQVLIQPNSGYSGIKEWYRDNLGNNIDGLSDLKVADQSAVRSPDGLRVYFLFGDNIYSLIYNIGLRTDANFTSTFNMMIKSFKLMSS